MLQSSIITENLAPGLIKVYLANHSISVAKVAHNVSTETRIAGVTGVYLARKPFKMFTAVTLVVSTTVTTNSSA